MERIAEMLLRTIKRAGYPVAFASITNPATGVTTYAATAVDDDGGRRLVTAPSGMQALFELADQIGFENLNRTTQEASNRVPTNRRDCMSKSCCTARKRERERMKVERVAMKRERRDQRKSERLKADTEHDAEGNLLPLVESIRQNEAPTFQEGGAIRRLRH
jgi:hypothetical protein